MMKQLICATVHVRTNNRSARSLLGAGLPLSGSAQEKGWTGELFSRMNHSNRLRRPRMRPRRPIKPASRRRPRMPVRRPITDS